MQDYSTIVKVGFQGFVQYQLLSSRPIVLARALLDDLVAGEEPGGTGSIDIRNSFGIRFSVPRVPGIYDLTVYAKDSMGCTTVTTAARPVQIQ